MVYWKCSKFGFIKLPSYIGSEWLHSLFYAIFYCYIEICAFTYLNIEIFALIPLKLYYTLNNFVKLPLPKDTIGTCTFFTFAKNIPIAQKENFKLLFEYVEPPNCTRNFKIWVPLLDIEILMHWIFTILMTFISTIAFTYSANTITSFSRTTLFPFKMSSRCHRSMKFQ